MNYYIGDLHLFNRNQTDEGRNYDRRPFATVEEMNQYILERWNAKTTTVIPSISWAIWPCGVRTVHYSRWLLS